MYANWNSSGKLDMPPWRTEFSSPFLKDLALPTPSMFRSKTLTLSPFVLAYWSILVEAGPQPPHQLTSQKKINLKLFAALFVFLRRVEVDHGWLSVGDDFTKFCFCSINELNINIRAGFADKVRRGHWL
jgi:hypothetical protein